MNYYFDALKKYARFSGRSGRKEYWYFTLINIIIGFLIGFFSGLFQVDSTFIVQIFSLAILLPSITVGVRRVHDVGKNGWYILIPVYNLILFCTDSVRGDNAYGSNPKGIICCHFFSCQAGFFGVGMWLIFTSFAMNGRLAFLTVSVKDNSILC